jgi:hypothetical protein
MARENEGVDTAGLEKKLTEFLGLRDSNTLWRITSWGAAATLALAAAVLMTTTDTGSQRLRLAFGPEAGAPANVAAQVSQVPKVPQTAPPAKVAQPAKQADKPAKVAEVAPAPPAKNPDTERLEAQIRELAADRDRLKARVASLEQNLNDMTGSIKRELELVAATTLNPAAKPEPKPETVPTAPVSKPSALGTPETMPPEEPENAKDAEENIMPTARAGEPLVADGVKAGTTSQAKLESKFAAKPEPRSEPRSKLQSEAEAHQAEARQRAAKDGDAKAAELKTLPGMPKITAVPLPPLRVATAVEPVAPPVATSSNEPALGIELGGARSMEILKKRWAAVKANFGPLVEGLHPLVTYDRHNPRIPYRLLVGPLANGAAAAQTCKRFAASRVTCRPTRFVGDVFAEK